MSLFISQSRVHYLIFRKVSLSPDPLSSVLICYSQTIRHVMNCKMKQSQYLKTDEGEGGGHCQMKTCITHTFYL